MIMANNLVLIFQANNNALKVEKIVKKFSFANIIKNSKAYFLMPKITKNIVLAGEQAFWEDIK